MSRFREKIRIEINEIFTKPYNLPKINLLGN